METSPRLTNTSQAVLLLCVPVFAVHLSLLNVLVVALGFGDSAQWTSILPLSVLYYFIRVPLFPPSSEMRGSLSHGFTLNSSWAVSYWALRNPLITAESKMLHSLVREA